MAFQLAVTWWDWVPILRSDGPSTSRIWSHSGPRKSVSGAAPASSFTNTQPSQVSQRTGTSPRSAMSSPAKLRASGTALSSPVRS